MKKRILSLVMALCMVALALPFAAFPITAAVREGFTSTLALNNENWPIYESGVAFKRFIGNWTMGYFNEGVYRQHYDFAKGNNIVTSGEAWDNTGVFLETGQIILTQGEGGRAFYAPATFQGNPISEEDMNKKAGVIAYTAPYTGTVELDIYSMAGQARETNNIDGVTKTQGAYFAIFVNGEMIWPTKGGEYSDVNDWALFNEAADGKNAKEKFNEMRGEAPITVDVTTRDVIQFAVALAPSCTSYFYMAPMVTYRDGYSVVPEAVTQAYNKNDHDWPTPSLVAGTWDMKQTDELWKMASFNVATGEVAPFLYYTKTNAGAAYAHHEDEDATGNNFVPKMGGIVLDHSNKLLVGAISKSSHDNLRAAYIKESIANGKMTVSLEGAGLTNATGNPSKNVTANLKVYVNGALKATAAIATDANGNLKNPVSATVDVARGDVVAIVPDDFGTAAYVLGTPVVAYSEITSFMNTTPDGANDIALEEIDIAVNGTIDLLVNAFATRNVYENASDVTLYIWDNTVTGEKTPANAVATIPMEMNITLFSFEARYNGFAIKELADELTLRVVAKDGDTVLASEEMTVVPSDVAYENYTEATDKKMKTLYANLLNYAAYAQVYFGYNTENLANADLPADLKALDYDMLYDAQFAVTKPSSDKTNISDSEIGSFALILDNTISLRAYVDRWITEMDESHGFYFQYGETLLDCYNAKYPERPADENLSYIVSDIGAHEMSDLHYFRLVVTYRVKLGDNYRDKQYFGYAMSYSVESYASRMLESNTEGLEDLVRAMMEFGKAAAAVY